jgi:hypothetical protein
MKIECIIVSSEKKKNKHLPFFYVSEENQAPHYFFREK